MSFQPSDYAILATSLFGVVVGLFIGFSGALAFLCGAIAAGAFATIAFPFLAGEIANVWVRGILVGVAALLVFGLVRLIVRKLVHGLLAQPGDAIFGALISALSGGIVALSVVWLLGVVTGSSTFDSALLQQVLGYVGGVAP